jgi:hypothetical protein
MAVTQQKHGEPVVWIEGGVRWSTLVIAVCELAESEAVRDGCFAESDADHLESAAKEVRRRARRAMPKDTGAGVL